MWQPEQSFFTPGPEDEPCVRVPPLHGPDSSQRRGRVEQDRGCATAEGRRVGYDGEVPYGGEGSRQWSRELIDAIRAQYRLDWNGLHGFPHWVRVRENGLRLAEITGADPAVVELFALFHDSRRHNDGWDPGHGARAAEFVETLNGNHFDLSVPRLELLKVACTLHSDGLVEGDITVQTCWDADRLDLGRIGTLPRPRLLCTEAARRPEILDWAWLRSTAEPGDPSQ
jgi:uncharacterized protein